MISVSSSEPSASIGKAPGGGAGVGKLVKSIGPEAFFCFGLGFFLRRTTIAPASARTTTAPIIPTMVKAPNPSSSSSLEEASFVREEPPSLGSFSKHPG